ncbi:MAG: hypothetical protein M3R47_01685 [Chloroflexota bacterium]|nr:hypothetical protein [Chloroflexota bacterium]
MYKNVIFGLLLISLVLFSCANPSPTPFSVTPGNVDEYLAPTYTPRPIPTPFSKSKNGEIVLLLRKRAAPFETVILRLPDDCLLSGKECDMDGNVLGVLPQGLSQVLKVYWTINGDKAFFWDDNTTDVYILDGNQGTFQVFKKQVLKVRDEFLVSPSGENTIFEIQENDNETNLVLMNNLSGDISNLDVMVPGAKYASQWLDDHTVLFWDEISEGKGYLVDLKLYTLNTVDHSVQPFDIGRDWMQTSVPVFSPNRELMAFTAAGNLVIRDALTAIENGINIMPERFLWFTDSQGLIVYSQNKEFFTVKSDGSEMQKIYALLETQYLEDWIWLADSEHLLLITTDDDGNRQIGTLSVVDKTFTPINFALLNDYAPVSFSFRP